MLAAAMTLAAAAAACDGALEGGASPMVPFASPPPANIVDDLVRSTVEMTGLSGPVEVIEIREGPLDQLRGLTPEAQASASILIYPTGRQSLERRAWRVRLVGSQAGVSCSTDPCARSRVYVEAYLDASTHTVIAVVVGPVPSGLATPTP